MDDIDNHYPEDDPEARHKMKDHVLRFFKHVASHPVNEMQGGLGFFSHSAEGSNDVHLCQMVVGRPEVVADLVISAIDALHQVPEFATAFRQAIRKRRAEQAIQALESIILHSQAGSEAADAINKAKAPKTE